MRKGQGTRRRGKEGATGESGAVTGRDRCEAAVERKTQVKVKIEYALCRRWKVLQNENEIRMQLLL